MEQNKLEIIALCLTEEYSSAITRCNAVISTLLSKTRLKENEHKALRQLIVFLSIISRKKTNDKLYSIRKRLHSALSTIVRYEIKNTLHTSIETWKKQSLLNEKQLNVLYQTTTGFQMTTGCSCCCRRCNEWAIPYPRKHFSFHAIKDFSRHIHSTGNASFIYYGASDPLDWHHNDKDLMSIVRFLEKNNYLPEYGFLTKLPSGKTTILKKLVNNNTDIAISITNKNRDKVEAIEKELQISLNKQHDVEELMIPAGLDEDFVTIKPSITDSYGSEITPDGAFMVMPTFTSALNLTGQHRIPITQDTFRFIEKKTGRNALSVEYYKPLDMRTLDGKIVKANSLFDGQLETIILDIGHTNITPPGMTNMDTFLETFEKSAVLKRKQLLKSVIKNAKEAILQGKPYRNSTDEKKKRYKKQLMRYLITCNIKKMILLKKNAISYFFVSIRCYLKRNASKRTIIRHLLKDETSRLQENYPVLFTDDSISTCLNLGNIDTYTVFRAAITRLLILPEDQVVAEFIDTHGSFYCADVDMFLPVNDPF